MSEYALEVTNLHKSFKLPTEKAGKLKTALVNVAKGIRGYREQKVLRGIDFKVKKGEFFGIVGRNGSGKSTLLKIISQIYQPSHGSVVVDGKLVPFIELGVGFNPELTGRENIYLNGALLGFSNKEIDDMYDEIVSFAELEQFMDQKLKNYSSGMQVRLAFSLAIRAKADILVLDEVLAVGDEAFQRKCNDYFRQIKESQDKTIILVTHSMDAVRQFCDRAIMINDGHIVADGSPKNVANEYNLKNVIASSRNTVNNQASANPNIKNLKAKLLSPKIISQKEKVKIQISYTTTQPISTNTLVSLTDIDRNIPLIGGRTQTKPHEKGTIVAHEGVFDLSQANDATIKVVVEVWDEKGNILSYLPDEASPKFIIRRTDYPKNGAKWAVLFNRGEWK